MSPTFVADCNVSVHVRMFLDRNGTIVLSFGRLCENGARQYWKLLRETAPKENTVTVEGKFHFHLRNCFARVWFASFVSSPAWCFCR